MHHIGEMEKKKEKKRKINFRMFFLFAQYTSTLWVYTKFENFHGALIGAQKSVTKTIIEEREKRTNKGHDKH